MDKKSEEYLSPYIKLTDKITVLADFEGHEF